MQDKTPTPNELIGIAGALGALVNIGIIAWQSLKRSKYEIKKLDNEGDVDFTEASLHTVEGAKISMELLQMTVEKLQKDLEAEKESRKKDTEYFRRRVREMDKENREYRTWAAKLVKQVIGAGLIPVPFEPIQESDPSLLAVTEPKEDK